MGVVAKVCRQTTTPKQFLVVFLHGTKRAAVAGYHAGNGLGAQPSSRTADVQAIDNFAASRPSNRGDEAAEHKQLTWETPPSESFEKWTSTAFKGSHRMICRIVKDRRVQAKTSHIVKVAPGRWWKR